MSEKNELRAGRITMTLSYYLGWLSRLESARIRGRYRSHSLWFGRLLHLPCVDDGHLLSQDEQQGRYLGYVFWYRYHPTVRIPA